MTNRTKAMLLMLLALVTALSLAACGGEDEAEGTDSEAATETEAEGGETNADLTISDFAFSGGTFEAGQTITVANNDGAPHTVTASDGSFNTGNIAGGESGELTLPSEPGSYEIFCEVHPTMAGTLTVS